MLARWVIIVSLLLICGCASMNVLSQGTYDRTLSLAKIAGILTYAYIPESRAALQVVCTASSMRDQDLMVAALQQLWLSAEKEQATALILVLNELVGTSKIMDKNPTALQLSEWQNALGTLCVTVKF